LAGSVPIRSISLAGMETSETASAWARTAFASRSRLARARRFESFQVLEEIPARAGGEPLQVEENARSHDRAGPAGAPHLVDASDQANATSPVVGKKGRVAH
jgi:hypothetical protein